jgi:hypothetical protein
MGQDHSNSVRPLPFFGHSGILAGVELVKVRPPAAAGWELANAFHAGAPEPASAIVSAHPRTKTAGPPEMCE